MSIQDIPKKINPVVNFWEKIYYGVKHYWQNKAVPLFSKIKESLDIKEDTFIVLTIILIGLAGFGLGKLSALEKNRQEVTVRPAEFATTTLVTKENTNGMLVASKSGKKYHFPWCAGAAQIAEKNKIWFDSYAEALKAGYTPASNCPGLK